MAWIELHQSLLTHHKTLALSIDLEIPDLYAASHMVALWLWALDNAPDGDLSKHRFAVVSRAAQWPGDPEAFVRAAVSAGYLDQDGDMLTIHDWYAYAGRHLERARWNAMRRTDAPAVMERDGWRCKRCGGTEHLTIDHIVPIVHGGRSDDTNLQTLCRSCNSRKGARA